MSDLASQVFATTARLLQTRATPEQLTTLAQGRAPDPTVFDETPPFFWLNEISSNRLDAYFTRMDPLTTLPNFAAEANEGRAFLIGHDNRTMPFGYTLTGAVDSAGDVTRVLADAYALQEPETAPFVRRVRAGIQRDTSVGFHGGQWICNICGRDMLTDWWNCWHVPGLVYEIKDSTGASTVVREVTAEALVKNAHLSEVSAVYDGATPGAAILLAQRAAEAGQILPEQVRLIETRYRIHLPGKRLQVSGAGLPTPTPAAPAAPALEGPGAEDARATPEEHTPVSITTEQIRSLFGLAEDADEAAHLRQLAAELPQLRQQAEEGKAAREALIAEALQEAVRAFGAEAEEANKAVLASLPTPMIRKMHESWRAIAAARFPGGRQSTDEAPAPGADDAAKQATIEVPEPEHLYRG